MKSHVDMQPVLFHVEMSPERVLEALAARRGSANGITARDLAFVLTGRLHTADERKLRQIVEHLRLKGHAICAHPSFGYHMASSASELDATCEFLFGRAQSSLKRISAMKKVALPDLRGQLGLPLTGESNDEPA